MSYGALSRGVLVGHCCLKRLWDIHSCGKFLWRTWDTLQRSCLLPAQHVYYPSSAEGPVLLESCQLWRWFQKLLHPTPQTCTLSTRIPPSQRQTLRTSQNALPTHQNHLPHFNMLGFHAISHESDVPWFHPAHCQGINVPGAHIINGIFPKTFWKAASQRPKYVVAPLFHRLWRLWSC